jgi:uncharacterized protein (DUF885 family)
MQTSKIFITAFLSLSVSFAFAEVSDKDMAVTCFRKFLDDEWDYVMHEYPTWATSVGYPGQNHRWTDVSLKAIERRKDHTRESLNRLLEIDKTQLNEADRLNYELYERNLKLSIHGQRFKEEYFQIDQLGGIQQEVAHTFAFMPTSNVEDFENILARFQGIPKQIDDTIILLKKGLKLGITPPRITLQDVPDQIKAQMVVDNNPMMVPFNKILDSIPEEYRIEIQKRAKKILVDKVIPAYTKLHRFFVETYLPSTRESIGFCELPDGKAWYAFKVKRSTTTEMSPEEIHQLGLREVKRIRHEMEQVIKNTGFEGSFPDFTEFLRNDPQFFFETPEELLAAYRDIAKRADYELVKLFGKLPRLPYGVLPVPSYAEKSQSTAYYKHGCLKTGIPGTFFANTYKLNARPKWEMESLTLHEAVPGHHLQISLAQEQAELPNFRKHGSYTAYIEGWGLYAETLGYEMGMYKDPYSKFGQLNYEMWRAARLVVDTGIHHFGWSRQRAIDFFKENMGKTEHDITVEIDRYIVWPSQALAYKVGQLKIKELREYSKSQLGEYFDIRAFHDQLLSQGALPLAILERQVKAWVKEQKKYCSANNPVSVSSE